MATDSETTEAPQDKTPFRVRPQHIALGIGVAFAIITVISGLVPLFVKTHDHSGIQREVFTGIPSFFKLAFYIVIPIAIVYGGYMFSLRVKNWERGQPDNRG